MSKKSRRKSQSKIARKKYWDAYEKQHTNTEGIEDYTNDYKKDNGYQNEAQYFYRDTPLGSSEFVPFPDETEQILGIFFSEIYSAQGQEGADYLIAWAEAVINRYGENGEIVLAMAIKTGKEMGVILTGYELYKLEGAIQFANSLENFIPDMDGFDMRYAQEHDTDIGDFDQDMYDEDNPYYEERFTT